MKERLLPSLMPFPVKPMMFENYIKESAQYPFLLRMIDVFIKASM